MGASRQRSERGALFAEGCLDSAFHQRGGALRSIGKGAGMLEDKDGRLWSLIHLSWDRRNITEMWGSSEPTRETCTVTRPLGSIPESLEIPEAGQCLIATSNAFIDEYARRHPLGEFPGVLNPK